jgi:hypothetical protein
MHRTRIGWFFQPSPFLLAAAPFGPLVAEVLNFYSLDGQRTSGG